MTQRRRAAIAIALSIAGWCFMGLAHDKPQWYFQASGIVGTVMFLGALGWWLVSGLAERDRRRQAEGGSMGDVGSQRTH